MALRGGLIIAQTVVGCKMFDPLSRLPGNQVQHPHL
jgi:hypothetical protein